METTIAPEHTIATTATTTLPTSRVTQRRVALAEWTKLRTVRSTVIGLASGAAVMILLGMLFSGLAGDEAAGGPVGQGTDAFSRIFAGTHLTQLILAVVGAVFVTTEYSTGLIRTMFATVTDRRMVLVAKAAAMGAATWVVMTAASFVTFFAGSAVYGGTDTVPSLSDDGVLRAILGTGFYAAGIAVLGIGLGFLLRTTASAVGVLVAGLMVAPVLVGLLPDSISDTVGKLLPSNSGSSFTSVTPNSDLLSVNAGFAVFVAWVVGILVAAGIAVHRRDA